MPKKRSNKSSAVASPTDQNEPAPLTSAENGIDAYGIALPSITVTHGPAKYKWGVDEVTVEKFDMAVEGKALLEDADLELRPGHRYAIIGSNGCGKSSLLRAMGQGQVEFPPSMTYYFVKEAAEASETVTALEAVLQDTETERASLELELENLADRDDAELRMEAVYERLDELEPETAQPRAARILFGLGFDDAMQARPTKTFSGGWRMRIALAKALFKNPTLLLLDAPTAHLDVEAVVWLERYLMKFKKILLMVSHSQDFMNTVCTDMLHMHQKKLKKYVGDYDNYVATRENLEINQQKNFDSEQKAMAHMKDYIRRFEHANEKRSRQAQSKMKVLDKMERDGLVEEVEQDRNVNFHFECAGRLPPPIIQMDNVGFHYPNSPQLYKGLNLGVDSDSRICLLGPNGAGKTTLTKMMIRELEATEGEVKLNAHARVARFHQHFVDLIDLTMSPLEWMMGEFPTQNNDPQPVRTALGRFGVSGVLQGMPMSEMSDGQKSRVVLAWMSHKKPHMMILDEPTNCLDMASIDALAAGIKHFEGAVVVVSHDLRLIGQIAKEIWICEKGHVEKFKGDVVAYKRRVAREVEQHMANHEKKMATAGKIKK